MGAAAGLPAHESQAGLGLAIGGNFSYGDYSPSGVLVGVASGFGLAGAVSISLFPRSILGLDLAEDVAQYSLATTGIGLTGVAYLSSALLHFNFDWMAHSHVVGMGYAYWYMPNSSAVGGSPEGTTAQGFLIEGKDFLLANNVRSGPFLAAKLFIHSPGGLLSPLYTLNFLMGYDF